MLAKKVESVKIKDIRAIQEVFPEASWNDMVHLASNGSTKELKAIKEIFPKATLDDITYMSRFGSAEDLRLCREMYPEASERELGKLVRSGTHEEVQTIRKYFNDAEIKDVSILLSGRRFSRWYAKNRKAIRKLSYATPLFALALHGITGGAMLALFGSPAIVAYAETAASSTVPVSFFGGKGAILLHMLVAGFFTLVVSSFLKFTGRGDLIPLVMFVGGAIILYEVIGLFNDIYFAIKTLLQM